MLPEWVKKRQVHLLLSWISVLGLSLISFQLHASVIAVLNKSQAAYDSSERHAFQSSITNEHANTNKHTTRPSQTDDNEKMITIDESVVVEPSTGVVYQAATKSFQPSRYLEKKYASSSKTEERRPKGHPLEAKMPLNILLLYADDWSFTTLGAMGNNVVKTPRLDDMAQNGVLFTHNCVTTSICMVSRATLYTGQYASRHQTFQSYNNLTMYEPGRWNQTLFPLMKQNGYFTGLVGKYHHHHPPKDVPTFDVFRPLPFRHILNRSGVVKHITQWNEDMSMEFLQTRPKGRPFFLTTSFFATHAQDGGPEAYVPMETSLPLYSNTTIPHPTTFTPEHFERLPDFFQNGKNFGRGRAKKRYFPEDSFQHNMKDMYRMATEVDAASGRLMDELERQGILNQTLVIFTTDNGNFHGHHGLAEKWFAYEESLRVPLIVMDPRSPISTRSTINNDFTLNIDLAPTILSAANIPVPDSMQGRDISELYLEPSSSERRKEWRTEFWYEWYGDKKVLPSNLALVRKDTKYIHWLDFGIEQVFDLKHDPFEQRDLTNVTDVATMNELRTRMVELQHLAIAGAKLWVIDSNQSPSDKGGIAVRYMLQYYLCNDWSPQLAMVYMHVENPDSKNENRAAPRTKS